MEKLKEIRNELLRLHKTLMDIERTNYEEVNGALSNLQLLNLLFENENFIWLRDISSLVADIDEFFAAKNEVTNDSQEVLFNKAKHLIEGNSDWTTFGEKYQQRIVSDKNVAAQHQKLIDLIKQNEA